MKRVNEIVSRMMVAGLFSLAVGAVWAQATPTPATLPAGSTDLSKASIKTTEGGRIESLSLPGLDINTALQVVATATKKNIVVSRAVTGSVNLTLYNITMDEVLNAMLEPNGFGYVEKGNFVYVYTLKEIDEQNKRNRKVVNKVFKLQYINATDANTLIKPLLSDRGLVALTPTASLGLPAGITDTGGSTLATEDTLVISDFADNVDAVVKALAEIDVRPKQVLVEASLLNATLDDSNKFGMDISVNAGIGSANLPIASLLNGQTPTPAFNNTALAGNSFNSVAAPAKGFTVGYMGSDVSVIMSALESAVDTNVLANPKILVLNKMRGEVFLGNEDGYLTTTVSNSTTVQNVETVKTGTRLLFRPFITEDNYIRMEIHPEDSTGGVSQVGSSGPALPSKTTAELTTNVIIKSGRTVVLGGLFRERTSSDKSQVPGLGNVPILGIPFRKNNDQTKRQELIVLMTPHIINDDGALYAETQKIQEDVRRMQLGNRAGMLPWGRDRIAQMWYTKAMEAKEAGNSEKAAMFADWAVNANPKFVEALQMREELTGKRMNEATTSSIHNFVRDVVAADAVNAPAPATQP